MKFCDSDEALLCKTILIGMPAVGKSALTNYLQDGFEKSTGRKIPVISTDEEIDKIGKNPENKLLRDFMASHGMTADDVVRECIILDNREKFKSGGVLRLF